LTDHVKLVEQVSGGQQSPEQDEGRHEGYDERERPVNSCRHTHPNINITSY